MRELEKSAKTKRLGNVEQDSTMGPNFAICSICLSWNLVGECLPQTLHLFCFRRSDGIRRPPFSQMKEETNDQNLQHPKTQPHRKNPSEHADFLRRLEIYDMNQSEFIREAISGATIKPTIVATLVSDDLLAAVGKLTAEYGRIGNNLNQIARHLNEWQSPYPAMAKEL